MRGNSYFKLPERLATTSGPSQAEAALTEVSEELRPIFAVAFYTELRKGDILGLRRDDVDLDGGTLAVRRS